MIKVIPPGSQKFDDCPSQIIKIGKRGLRGQDLRDFIKRAGHTAAEAVKKLEFAPGEVPIHLIAIGATEYYGPNRNGDGFKIATCRKYHDTFVKRARWYRNHQNKDPRRSYGIVKMSVFNEDMKRIELVVALNGTKEAAERNGGLVADQELEKISRHEENWGVSMACKVPFDVCSGCGNKARSREEYCTEQTCPYGGLKHNITKVAEDGHVLHADNPDPIFFDISDVFRPADRIAWVLGTVKAASMVKSGAELAEELGLQDRFVMTFSHDDSGVALLTKLADVERSIENRQKFLASDYLSLLLNDFSFDIEDVGRSFTKTAGFLQGLAEKKAVAPLRTFLRLKGLEKRSDFEDLHRRTADFLPGIYSRLLSRSDCDEVLASSPYRFRRGLSGSEIRIVEKCASLWSLDKQASVRRIWSATLCNAGSDYTLPICAPSPHKEAEKLAEEYALYKLAFLDRWKDDANYPRLERLVVEHNYVEAGRKYGRR